MVGPLSEDRTLGGGFFIGLKEWDYSLVSREIGKKSEKLHKGGADGKKTYFIILFVISFHSLFKLFI